MDEGKKYSIIGKVEIGTDEYRDLIERNSKLESDYNSLLSKKWELDSKLSTAEKQVSILKNSVENFKLYLTECHKIDDFKLWSYKRDLEENTEPENE